MTLLQAEAPSWQTFPWGTLLTFGTVLATLGLAALVNHLRKVFLSRDEANAMSTALRGEMSAMGNALRDHIGAMNSRMGDIEEGCAEANRAANEAFRMAQLTDRSQGEQWQRVTEELIKPVRQMAKELSDTRELVIKYITTQDGHAKEMERLERRVAENERRKGDAR